jgi:hypothetical protein
MAHFSPYNYRSAWRNMVAEQAQERRRFTRIHFDAKCTLKSASGEWEVQLVDICFKGALTETKDDIPLRAGDKAELIIALDDEGTVIEMPAEINHKIGRFLGFQASHMELSSITHLRRLVELNLGDQALLDRELEHLYH